MGIASVHPLLQVLSTNHLMQGTHRLPPRAKYELPLLTREQYAALLTALGRDQGWWGSLPMVDIWGGAVSAVMGTGG